MIEDSFREGVNYESLVVSIFSSRGNEFFVLKEEFSSIFILILFDLRLKIMEFRVIIGF